MLTDPVAGAPAASPLTHVDWRVVAFFVLAGGLHYQLWFWAQRIGGLTFDASWVQFALPPVGFAFAAVVSYRLFQGVAPLRIATLPGLRDLALAAVPLGALFASSFAVPDGERIRAGMIGPMLLSLPAFVIEEFAWRGFLQEQLRPLGRWPRYVLVAVLFQLCHLDFVPADPVAAAQRFLYALPVAIVVAVLAGDLVENWKSLLPAVVFQVWMELLAAMPGPPVYVGFFVAMVMGLVIYKRMPAPLKPQLA